MILGTWRVLTCILPFFKKKKKKTTFELSKMMQYIVKLIVS